MDIAYQLYTSRKATPVTAQFPFLKGVGYDHIEVGPADYQADPKAFRDAMIDANLDAPSMMIAPLTELNDLGEFIEVAHILGAKTIVRPWLAPHQRPTDEDQSKRLAERLSAEAQTAHGAGLTLAWHNHDFEFIPLADGTRPIDSLVRFSDPLLRLELDCGWVFRAGADVATELRMFADRIIAIHAKDAAPLGTVSGVWAAVGDGIIDWRALLPDLMATHAVLAVVEHDEAEDWQYVARRSFETLSQLLGTGLGAKERLDGDRR